MEGCIIIKGIYPAKWTRWPRNSNQTQSRTNYGLVTIYMYTKKPYFWAISLVIYQFYVVSGNKNKAYIENVRYFEIILSGNCISILITMILIDKLLS